eukprot:CAMPEP_0119570960 /NCGR_PEP_ID=MMETSP1352-20130426/43879_1 /TAXON_ID=265584 /ORGANISM="Stauroneis constricta, Strain CCMP1120" /LENGTH=895 /DNA_ID=CAMNT_0007620637 /DNA_START=201 /DNA_END=2889 /DNA_ORIENTATION=+
MQNSMWKNGRRGGMMEDGTQGGNQLPFQLNDAAPANNGTSTGPMMIMPTSGDNGGIDQFALRQNTNGTAYHHEDDQKIASSNINGNTSEGMTGVPPMFFGTTNCFFESSVPQPAPPSSGDRGATGDARMWHASSSAAGQHSSSSASSARPSASSSSAARLQASLQAMSNSTPAISSSAASRPRKNASWPRAASCSFPLPSATRGRGNRSNRRSSDEDRRRMGGDFSDLPAVMSNAAVLRGDGMVATTNPQVPAGASGIDGLNDNSSYVSSSPGSSQQPTHILQQQLQAQLQSQLRQLELKQQKLLLEQQLQIQRMKIEQMEANMQVQQQQHQNHFGLDGSLQSQQGGGALPHATTGSTAATSIASSSSPGAARGHMQVQQQQHQNRFGLDGSLQGSQQGGGMLPHGTTASITANSSIASSSPVTARGHHHQAYAENNGFGNGYHTSSISNFGGNVGRSQQQQQQTRCSTNSCASLASAASAASSAAAGSSYQSSESVIRQRIPSNLDTQQKLLLEQQLQIQRMKIEQMQTQMQVQQQQHQNRFGLDGCLQSQHGGGTLPHCTTASTVGTSIIASCSPVSTAREHHHQAHTEDNGFANGYRTSDANCGGHVLGWSQQQPRRSTDSCASRASAASAASSAAAGSSYQTSESVYSSAHSEQSGYEQVEIAARGGAGDDDHHALSSMFGFNSFIIDPSVPGEVDPSEQDNQNSRKRKGSESAFASLPPATAAGDDPNSSSPPPVKTTHVEKWNLRYRDLLKFKEQCGHCLVPLESPENPPLAHWVKRQRCQWKLRSKGKKSTLTDHRFELLDDLGFVWDAHQAAWQFRLVQLRQFARVHGHANVPSRYAPNQSLAVWSKCQRRMKRMHDSGDRSSLTAERIADLTSIGFAWDIRNPPTR